MSKQRKSNIEGRKVDPVKVSGDNIPEIEMRKVDYDEDKDFLNYKKKDPMLKRILKSKIAKGITSVLGGVVGFGGSVFAGLDPEFAFLVVATAVIAIFGGMEKAAQFKGLFDDQLKDQDSN